MINVRFDHRFALLLWWASLVALVAVGCFAGGYETRRAIDEQQTSFSEHQAAQDLVRYLIDRRSSRE